MVLRTSNPIGVSSPKQAAQVRQSSVGGVNPDVRKFSQGGDLRGESTADRLLTSLLPAGQQFAEKAFKAELEEQYLQGVAQAATVKSEDDLETDLMTSDWTKAGYRDTVGRLAVNQQQAQFQVDLPRLAQGTPEQFQQYMDEKQKPIVDQMNGMSKRQRAAMFGQVAMDTATAGKKYTVARAAWIQEQEQKSIQQSMTVRRGNLDAAKGDMGLYAQEVQGFVGAIYKDVWQNPKLTPALQVDMTRQAMEFASSSDNVAVYDAMKNTVVEFADGTKGTMMSRMPFEDQIKVDKAHRQAMDRVKVVRSQDFETQIASWEAQWADPNVGATQSYEEVDQALRVAANTGVASPGKRESVLQNFFKAKALNNENGALAQAYAKGDVQTLFKAGKTQEEALKTWLKVNKDMPLDAAVSSLMAIGVNNGMDSALKQAGTYLNTSFATLGFNDEIDPTNAKLVTNTLAALSLAEKTNPGAQAKFLQTLSPDNQDLTLYMSELQQSGISDPFTVTKQARAKVQQDKSAGGFRQEAVQQARKDDLATVQDIDDRQLLGTISAPFKAFFSTDAANRDKLRTGRAWFENSDRTAEVRAQSQVYLAEELDTLGRTNPYMSAKSRQSKALANLAARTVDTESGPLTMPRGQTVQSFFKVPPYADSQYVGQAIDTMMKPHQPEGSRTAWTTTPQNQLSYTVRNKDNKVIDSGIINPGDVAPAVQQQLDADSKVQARNIGPGTTVQGVQFNGLNTANVEPSAMYQLRQDIIGSEGVSDVAYKDSNGKSFGVGIHSSNGNYQPPLGRDGKYSPEQIRDTFLRASNEAAELGVKSMNSIGVSGPEYLRFFGELAYQSPKSARDPDLLAHISLGNKQEAVTALMQTPAYKNSPDSRKASYLAKLKSAMR